MGKGTGQPSGYDGASPSTGDNAGDSSTNKKMPTSESSSRPSSPPPSYYASTNMASEEPSAPMYGVIPTVTTAPPAYGDVTGAYHIDPDETDAFQTYVGSGTVILSSTGVRIVTDLVDDLSPPSDHMMLSLCGIMCCTPVGLFAVLKSAECRAAIGRGDMALAHHLSEQARNVAWVAISFGIILTLFAMSTLMPQLGSS